MISPQRVEGARPLRVRLLSDPRWMVWLLAAVAWLVALGLTIVGPGLADHRVLHTTDRLSASGFLGGWQVMIAATMLPTTIPMVQYFGRASLDQPNGRSALFVFLLA